MTYPTTKYWPRARARAIVPPPSTHQFLSSHILSIAALALLVIPGTSRAQDVPVRQVSLDSHVYLELQVDKTVRIKSAVPPRYPGAMRAARQEGEVLVQYVVDERGQPRMETFMVITSPHPDFSQAVRRTVTTMTFYPAELAGQRVRQLVQQPFRFSLNH